MADVEAVRALHRAQTYYAYDGIEDSEGCKWVASLAELRRLYEESWEREHYVGDGPAPDWDSIRVLVEERTYCAHCVEVVAQAVEPYAVPFSPIAVFPCWTLQALDGDSPISSTEEGDHG